MTEKTPRKRRQARNREAILQAARELLLEGGHETLSLRAIARRADFSPAGLYEYFDGKDAIVTAMAARAMEPLRLALAAAGEVATGGDAVVRAGQAYIAFARQNPEDFLLLFSRLGSQRQSHDDPLPSESAFGLLLGFVRGAIDTGEVAPPGGIDANGVAYAVWALAHGAAMLQLSHLQGYDADFGAADEMALRALLAGLGPGAGG